MHKHAYSCVLTVGGFRRFKKSTHVAKSRGRIWILHTSAPKRGFGPEVWKECGQVANDGKRDEVHTVLAGLGAKDKYVRKLNVQSRPGSDTILLNRRARMF